MGILVRSEVITAGVTLDPTTPPFQGAYAEVGVTCLDDNCAGSLGTACPLPSGMSVAIVNRLLAQDSFSASTYVPADAPYWTKLGQVGNVGAQRLLPRAPTHACTCWPRS